MMWTCPGCNVMGWGLGSGLRYSGRDLCFALVFYPIACSFIAVLKLIILNNSELYLLGVVGFEAYCSRN
jgi:hypothetical protein